MKYNLSLRGVQLRRLGAWYFRSVVLLVAFLLKGHMV